MSIAKQRTGCEMFCISIPYRNCSGYQYSSYFRILVNLLRSDIESLLTAGSASRHFLRWLILKTPDGVLII
ncbi:MAG: hypothetical protein ACI92I_000654 [Acidimicrobiales bacterium]|jgi:hypothetical protein